MYSAISKCRKHNLSIDCKLDIFDKAVKSIILYGCEVWGFTNYKMLEKLHLRFCKHILKLRTSTPNCMIYGELGRYPLEINVKLRMVNFWANLIKSSHYKLSVKMFNIIKQYNTPWVQYVQKIFDDCGLSYIWLNQDFSSISWLKKTLFHKLKDQFLQKWRCEVFNSPKFTEMSELSNF